MPCHILLHRSEAFVNVKRGSLLKHLCVVGQDLMSLTLAQFLIAGPEDPGGTGILAGHFYVRDRLEACPTHKTEGLSP